MLGSRRRRVICSPWEEGWSSDSSGGMVLLDALLGRRAGQGTVLPSLGGGLVERIEGSLPILPCGLSDSAPANFNAMGRYCFACRQHTFEAGGCTNPNCVSPSVESYH